MVRYYLRLGSKLRNFTHGEMAEWSKAPVLKTGDVKASVGSNPTLSARFSLIWYAEVPKWPKGLPC